MRTIRLVIEYDGTAFAGWQIQLGRDGPPSVQGALQAGLSQLVKEPVRVRGASRTDAGVHARGQVVAFETTKDTIPLRAFERGLVALLPPSLVVRKVELAEDGWDPRRTSRGKRYRYTFWNDVAPTALERDRAWFVRTPLDLAAMQAAADRLLGTHDFEAFRSAGCDAKHAVRTMYELRVWRGEYARVHFDVVGNAFCRNMVRIFAGNLRDVGLRRMTPDDVGALLSSRDRAEGAMTAPPQGLCLEEVIYDDRLPPRPKPGRDVAPSTAAGRIDEALAVDDGVDGGDE
ncbi:tRNA pseudouridine(38-40) synthase TruA [Myxococcota bacterium]|nr:tRNA pseudouridine(38-40) synthase TruA [Myxococcota bacterium]